MIPLEADALIDREGESQSPDVRDKAPPEAVSGKGRKMRNYRTTAKGLSLAAVSQLAIMASFPATAVAQEADNDDIELEEVLVTARRRAESVQDIPISVTAISGDDLAGMRAFATKDIGNHAPNVNLVQGNFGFGAPIISVRGVTNGDFGAVSNTPVTVYSDDIVLTNILSHGFSLYDLERVELLRGPQGTLFGRNSTSGAMQFISKGPTEDFEAGGHISYAKYGEVASEAYISGSMSDNVRVRVSGFYQTRGGVVENVVTGEDESEIDVWSLRGIVEADLSDRLTVRVKAQTSESSGTGVIFHNSLGDNPFNTPATPEPGGDAGNFSQVALDLPSRPEDLRASELSGRFEFEINENWSLTGVLGHVNIDFEEFNDDDGTITRGTHEYAERDVKQSSAELRLAGEVGSLDLVMGAFWMTEKTDSVGAFEFTDDPFVGTLATNAIVSSILGFPLLAPTDRLVTTTELSQDLDAVAFFAHGKMPLTERFSISAGLRYSKDKKDIDVYDGGVSSFSSDDPFAYGQSVQNNPFFTNYVDGILYNDVAGLVSEETDADAVTGEFSLEFTPSDDALIYASYRRGFKGSSFASSQATTAFGVPVVGEESVNAYELGAKTSWADGRVILNGAAFFYDYNNFQAFEFLSVNGFLTNFLFSIPEVQIKGLELELQAQPTERLNLFAGIGLLDSEITDANVSLPPGVVLTVAKGNEIRNAPNVNINAGISYDFSVGSHYLRASADYFYVGEYYSDFINTEPGTQYGFDLDGDTVQETFITSEHGSLAGGYGQLNLAFTLTPMDERYAITVFGQNVTNELQVTGRFPGNFANGGTDFATFNDGSGRVWGVQLNLKF